VIAGDVTKLFATAREAWPEVELDVDSFAQRIDASVAAGAALADLHATDLYLACACGAGSPEALAIFERTLLAEIPQFVARFRRDAAFADEVAQRLRVRLFVGDERRIAEYAGRGPLRAWLRVAAIRTAVNLLDAPGAVREPDVEAAAGFHGGAELALVKVRHRDQLRAALEAAILALPPKSRTLLRMHHIDGYTLDRLAIVHRVHRATVARWLAAARAQIVGDVRERLATDLVMSPAEIDSLVVVVQSQLELSLSRLFASDA
jgi:RNA polymerase sigma-70 factor (ECF subfamily)